MRRVFIGHRGVGKTSLLRRHQGYFPDVAHFDLDAEIEKSQQHQIFFKIKANQHSEKSNYLFSIN